MQQIRTLGVVMAVVGLAVNCGPGVSTQMPLFPNTAEVRQSIEEMSANGYEPTQANGCRVKGLLDHLAAEPDSEVADEARLATLNIPPDVYCWNRTSCEASGPCDKHATAQDHTEGLAALIQLHFGSYGFREQLTRDPELVERFVAQFARVLNTAQAVCEEAEAACYTEGTSEKECAKGRARCLAMKTDIPGVVSLLDGMWVDNFARKRKACCPDVNDAAFVGLFQAYAEALKEHELASAVPKTIVRAEAALVRLTADEEEDDVTDAKVEAERRARDEARERERLRAELERKLRELQEAMERARRASEVAMIAKRQLAIRALANAGAASTEEEALAEAKARIDAQCRSESTPLFMGESPVKAILAEIHCLLAVAKDYPSVVNEADHAKLNSLFLALEETVIGFRLDGLRISPTTLKEVSALFETFDQIPLVTDAWKSSMHGRLMAICTDYVDELAQGGYEDVLRADEWVQGCLAGNARLKRKVSQRIARRLKSAHKVKADEEARLEREREKQEAAAANANSARLTQCNEHRSAGKNWRGCLDAEGAKCCQGYDKPDDCSYDSYEPGKTCWKYMQDICSCYPPSR